MSKIFALVAVLGFVVPTYGQLYTHNSGEICEAYSFVSYTFPDTPTAPYDATLEVSWIYCGPYLGNNHGTLTMHILIDGIWVELAEIDDEGSGCSSNNSDVINISASDLNASMNSNGGDVIIRDRIIDGCPPGVGCSAVDDACFNATLCYESSVQCFDCCCANAPCFHLADVDNDNYIGTPDVLGILQYVGCQGEGCWGDLNNDLVVDMGDFLIFLSWFGYSYE